MNEIYLLLSVLFVQNLALSYGLGLLPVLRIGKTFSYAWADFFATVIPMCAAGVAAWALNQLFSVFLHLEFVRTIVFALCAIGVMQGLRSSERVSSRRL